MAAPAALARPRARTRRSRGLRILLYVLVAVIFGRVHDLLPVVSTLPVAKVLVPLGWLMVLAQPSARSRLAALRTTQAKMLGLLVFAMIISVPFSVYVGNAVGSLRLFLVGILPYMLLVAVVCADEALLYDAGKAIALTEVLLGVAILAGRATMWQGRLYLGAMYDSNDLALVGVVSFPFAVWLLGDRSRIWRWIGIASAGGALATIVMSASRGGMLGIGAVMLLVAVRYGGRVPLKWKIIAALVVVVALRSAPATFWDRLQTLKDPNADYNATTETGRLAIWRRGFGYFLQRPLTGVGLGQFPAAEGLWSTESRDVGTAGFKWSVAHSVWISVLAELGLFGIIGYLGMYLPTLAIIRRAHSRAAARAPPHLDLKVFGDALGIAIIGFFVSGTFLAMQYSPPAMMLAAVGIGYARVSAMARQAAPGGGTGRAPDGRVVGGPVAPPAAPHPMWAGPFPYRR